MRVLIYAPLAVLGHHFETDLELAEGHLAAGDEVFFVSCAGALSDLGFMSCRGWLRCSLCTSRCDAGLSLIEHKNLRRLSLGDIPRVPISSELDLASLEDVKRYSYKGSDIGSAYVSSLISDLRNPTPDMVAAMAFTQLNLETLQGLVDTLESLLQKVKPDRVYFFNGRFSLYRPLLRLCQQQRIPFVVHERGARNDLYSLSQNNMPHDIASKITEINGAWDSAPATVDKVAVATKWFEGRASGQMLSWRSFTQEQQENLLPPGWDASKRNISFFISSEDEFASVPGWEMDVFRSQADAIRRICQRFSGDASFRFYVRSHPNLRGLKNNFTREVFGLEKELKNCTVILPESPVSTYALLRNSEKVVSFGTTVGVEATFWGIPCVLLGKSLYGGLEACHSPRSQNEAYAVLEQQNLPAASRDAALRYGFWASTVGVPFRFYKPMNLTSGAFKGRIITGRTTLMVLNYAYTFFYDLRKVFQGEYGMWHLTGKIKNKLQMLKRVLLN